MVRGPDGAPPDQLLAPPLLVDTPDALARMLDDLGQQSVVALDTEADSLYRYFHKVCLIQVSATGGDYLVDPLRQPDLTGLGVLLADARVEKVFHAAENDILSLQRDFGFACRNIFDTMLAARILGQPRVSLAALLDERFGLTLDKRTQLTDWGQRPLTETQLRYARLDSHFLLPLRDMLEGELKRAGRWREAQEAFQTLAEVQFTEKAFDPEGFWRCREARNLGPTELAVLRELYIWRDQQARAWNRPPFKVMSDEGLIRLSRTLPSHSGELLLDGRQSRGLAPAILAAVERGRVAPPPQWVGRGHNGNDRPDPATLARYDRLRAWRTQRATERGVDIDLILTNQALKAIARAAPASVQELAGLGVMGPWKVEEYGPELLRVVAGGP